jgi:hypothetical protein
MKKVLAILVLSLTSCQETLNPTICLTCVATTWKDEAEVPLAGFPDYGRREDGSNYELCDQPKDSKDVTKIKIGTRYLFRNNIGYKITRTQIYNCNPK